MKLNVLKFMFLLSFLTSSFAFASSTHGVGHGYSCEQARELAILDGKRKTTEMNKEGKSCWVEQWNFEAYGRCLPLVESGILRYELQIHCH